ncbi:hypothetical protein EYF80_023715 [Liparis tanakae]|uniref:Uncharacterized protein n=1 Tax=Liparis tanakae TaxID=230148 RepID=A0A4Z2HJY3_9TELE|nr:hypothetical protein EYF80_023715 [Liparis tanakae]
MSGLIVMVLLKDAERDRPPVTVTNFPDMSIKLSVLLDTSLFALVVRRVTSSTLLHTPITSAIEDTNQYMSGKHAGIGALRRARRRAEKL